MKTEDFKPLYNKKGEVNDPEIAREMAKGEEDLRNNPEHLERLKTYSNEKNNQKVIDELTDRIGESMHNEEYDKYMEERMDIIIRKLKGVLTADEVDVLEEYAQDEEDGGGSVDTDFLFRVLRGEIE